MNRKKFWKRVISSICACAIMMLPCTQSAIAANSDIEINTSDGYTYQIEWITDSDFVITGFVDGDVLDRVSGSIGGDYINVEYLSSAANFVNENIQLKVSDYITPVETYDEQIQNPIPLAYNNYAGNVKYQSLGNYYTLHIYYDIVNSYHIQDQKITIYEDTTLTQVVGIILSATGVLFPALWAKNLVIILGGMLSGGVVSGSVSGYFMGTKYNYNLKAENRAATEPVSKTYSGAAFDGEFRQGYSEWKPDKWFDGYYPQFIRMNDIDVASWLYHDFFAGVSFDVAEWNTEI